MSERNYKRRWFQFSLTTLFVVVAAVALLQIPATIAAKAYLQAKRRASFNANQGFETAIKRALAKPPQHKRSPRKADP